MNKIARDRNKIIQIKHSTSQTDNYLQDILGHICFLSQLFSIQESDRTFPNINININRQCGKHVKVMASLPCVHIHLLSSD